MATYTVTITGSGNSNYVELLVNDYLYLSDNVLTEEEGTPIDTYASGGVTLNGVNVGTSYSFELASDVQIALSSRTISITTSSGGGSGDGHFANVSGMAYEIEGGTVLIGGVGREIGGGLTLVGGVSKEISFGPSECVLNISGSGKAGNVSVTVNEQEYYSSAEVVVPAGTTIVAMAMAGLGGGSITLNGVEVGTPSGDAVKYSHTVTTDLDIVLYYGGLRNASVTITTL